MNDFISEFKAKRTLAHMRRIKSEKMKELVLEAQRNPSSTTTTPVITPGIPTASPRNSPVPTRPAPSYPGSTQNVTPYPQYPGQPRYPANAFAQPAAQQYPGYSWK